MTLQIGIKYIAKLFIIYCLFYFVLLLYYFNFISPNFSYEGFSLDFTTEKFIISIAMLMLLSSLFYGLKRNRPSTYLFNIMIFVSAIPMLVLFASENLDFKFVFFFIISLLLIRMVLVIKIRRRLRVASPDSIYKIVFFASIVLFIWLLILNWKYFNLNIMEVYKYRHIISEHTPKFLSYMYNIVFKGLLPLLFLYFLFNEKSFAKKLFFTLALIIFYVTVFGLTSHKFYLFVIFILLLLYMFATKFDDIATAALVLFIVVLLVLYFIDADSVFVVKSLLVRRLLFVPAQINFDFYSFFSQNAFVYFTDSKFLPFGYLMAYPYDLDMAHLIGREIYGHAEMSANTSWIGYGYAHAGISGMLLYAGIIGLVFKYLDFLAKFLHYKFIILSFFPYVIVLFLSSDLKTVFFTHGLLFYLVVLTILSFGTKKYRGEYAKNS